MNNWHTLPQCGQFLNGSAQRAKLQQRCRVCRSLLVAKGKRKRPSYLWTGFSERLNSVFSIDWLYCFAICANRCTTHYSSTNIYQWEAHTDEGRIVKKLKCTFVHVYVCACEVYYVSPRSVNPSETCVKSTQAHPRGRPTTISSITACIKGPHYSPNCDAPLASTNNPAILDHLQCPICMDIQFQPLELPCRTLVCACIVMWFTTFDCIGVMCPCCWLIKYSICCVCV